MKNKYVYLFNEANGLGKELLGGKGAGLAEAGHAGGMQVACVGDASQAGAGDFNMKSFAELLEIAK